MRLTALTLYRYGNFEAERIPFDPRPGVLNLLIAPNGAGKSVLRNAFEDLLFRIHNQTPMGFRFGYPNMRITAEIRQPDGSSLTLERRKTRGNVLTAADGTDLDPAVVGALLGSRDRELLERLFALDTDRLREGGRALLESGGDLASALLSASGGMREARQVLRSLEKDRDDLAPTRRVAQRPFYRALDAYADARKRLGVAQIKPDEREAQQEELDSLEQQQREQNAKAEAASAEISRLERIRRVRPLLAERDAAAAWLDANPDAPALPADLRARLADAHVAYVKTENDVANAIRTLATIEAQLGAITVDTVLLAEAAAIEALTGEAGAARKAVADIPRVTAQQEAKLAQLADMLRKLGSDLPPIRAADVIPQRALQARTQRLIRDYTEPMAAMRTVPAQRANRMRELADINRKLAELPAPPDLGALDSLVREIGDPVTPGEDAARAQAEAAAALASALARVPGWHGDATELAALKPLPGELYVRQDQEVRDATTAETMARQTHVGEAKALQAALASLAEIAGSGNVPDAATLRQARSHRDAAWRLIYRHAFTTDKPAREEEFAVTAGTPLPLAFERAMAAADRLADDRATASEHLARIDEARRTVATREACVVEAADRLRIEQEQADAARRAWMQICAPLPLGPSPALTDVQAFIAAREKVLDAVASHSNKTHAVETLAAKHAALASRLSQIISPPHGDLPSLLSSARRALDEGRKLEKARLDLETQRAVAEKELRETETAVAEAETRLESWRTDWQALLTELHRPIGEDPAVTEEVLHLLNDIDTENREAVALSVRIADMNRDVDRFGESVRSVAARVPGGNSTQDPFDTARELTRRLAEQKERQKQRDLLISQRDDATKAATEYASIFDRAGAARSIILHQIGVDSIEAAEVRLTMAETRTRFELQRDGADTKLREAGDAFPIEQLRAEVASVPPDDVQGRLDALAADRRNAGQAAQSALEKLTGLRLSMQQRADDTAIHAASADRQAAVASVSNTLEDAMLLHTAAAMLDMALRSVEQSGDSGLLQRIGTIFQALTLGAYIRVISETDGDSAARLVLLQQAFPQERQTVDHLSEGTRDQLFLALRVAEIERHLTGATPLPFIGDDILQTFDDDRALAAMQVLTELSRHTQIILLSHHRHVLDLSHRLPAGTVHVCERETALTPG